MKNILNIAIIMLALLGCKSYTTKDSADRAAELSDVTNRILKAEKLLVINANTLSTEEKLLFSTLQGLVSNFSTTQIYLHPHYGGYDVWLEDLAAKGVKLVEISDPWSVLEIFKQYIDGYILCSVGELTHDNQSLNDQSINVANSLVSLLKAPAVDESLEQKIKDAGFTMVQDVRGKDDKWVFENYKNQLSRDIVFEQKEVLIPALRDFAVATGAYIFFDGNSSFRKEVAMWTNQDVPVFGWGAKGGEEKFVGMSSKSDLYTIPADHTRNLSVFSGFDAVEMKQKDNVTTIVEEDVHYVSFLMSDGDNIQWMLGDLYSDSKWWGNDKRASIPMGWATSPIMLDVAPTILNRYYEEASMDHFVVGPSGSGYLYPSDYSPEALSIHTERLNKRMGQADLGVVEIIDFGSFKKNSIWDTYTKQENIDALFYLEYSNHKYHKGKIRWSNNKPIITPREMLWEGLRGCNEESVIKSLNKNDKDPTSGKGYSLVLVHAWSNGLDNIQNVIDGLDSNVKVVTPDELVRLVSENVIHK
ncbi:MAG: GxGYxYP family putative glycoside hydrolase [Spirochaetaceae bacterium]